MRLFLVGVFAVLLVGCGENTEEAYDRGVEDGAAEVCYEVRQISDRVYDQLRSRRYC